MVSAWRTLGDIVIRDMILREYTKLTTYLTPALLAKIRANEAIAARMDDVALHFGPVTMEQYQQIFALLGMEVILEDQQLLPFLLESWVRDFGFTDTELDPLKSTGFFGGEKAFVSNTQYKNDTHPIKGRVPWLERGRLHCQVSQFA